MDRLSDEERVLAWKASWHPSFDGVAIVNKDFTFRSVNPQFCKLLGVTPADLIGTAFQDITAPSIKKLEEKNAKLVISGVIDFYILPKKYCFFDGREVEVVLLVTRAPASAEGEFQFFVSRIMLDEKGELLKPHEAPGAPDLQQSFPKSAGSVVNFMMKYGSWLAALGTIIASILVAVWGKK